MSQIERPRPSSLTAPSIWYAEVAVPQTKPAGNLAGSGAAMVLLSCAVAGPNMPRPARPASLAKFLRENLPAIVVPRQACLDRRRALLRLVRLIWIELIGGNAVDLELHHPRRFAIDNTDAAEPFRAHGEVDDHVHGIIETDRHLDIGN